MKPYYSDNLVTLYHGDFRDTLANITDFIAITDPPYGIKLSNHGGNHFDRPYHDLTISGDTSQIIGLEFLELWGNNPLIIFASPMKPWPGKWRQHLVWNKGAAVGGGGDIRKCWHYSWELIQVRNTPQLNGIRESSVLDFKISPHNFKLHPAAKPLSLMKYLVSKVSTTTPIYDPFTGSGSTLVAAKTLNIPSVGIEVEEKYCEIAAKRLSND